MNSCANTSFGADLGNDSSVAYNVGGNAGCEVRTIGDDDSSGTPAVFRGLYSHGAGTPAAGCGDNTGRGAFDMIHVVLNDLGIGENLVLANQNGPFISACLLPGSAAAIDPIGLCGRAHWMIFTGHSRDADSGRRVDVRFRARGARLGPPSRGSARGRTLR